MNSTEFRVEVADDDCLPVSKHCIRAGHHQSRDVRNTGEDEIPVGTDQCGNVYISVVNAEVVALPDEPFDHFDDWTLAKVIRTRLEAEPEDSNTFISIFQYRLDSARNLHLVAGQNRAENRKLQIMHLCLIRECSQIFRKARTTKSKARF